MSDESVGDRVGQLVKHQILAVKNVMNDYARQNDLAKVVRPVGNWKQWGNRKIVADVVVVGFVQFDFCRDIQA